MPHLVYKSLRSDESVRFVSFELMVEVQPSIFNFHEHSVHDQVDLGEESVAKFIPIMIEPLIGFLPIHLRKTLVDHCLRVVLE